MSIIKAKAQLRMQQISQQLKTYSTATAPVAPVLIEKNQSLRHFILDRPTALNALNLEMIQTITPQLKVWQQSDLCKVIVISNRSTSRAFCAGGDVKSNSWFNLILGIVNGLKSDDPKAVEIQLKFFEEEYKLNHLLATTKKPIVSILNGITMGGGVGLSVHGQFRIVTENTKVAMPETAIGLFPDVGGSFFLPRLDGYLGTFLGLSGHVLKGEDAYFAGFGTHFISSSRLEPLLARLAEIETDNLEVVNACIDEFSSHIPAENFKNWSLGGKIGSLIDRVFRYKSLEEIFVALQKETNSSDPEVHLHLTKLALFAQKQQSILNAHSPLSLKVTLAQLRRGSAMHIADCFKMEYRMTRQFLSTPDFVEGVTSKLIEKRATKWVPPMEDAASLTPDVIDSLFFSYKPEWKGLTLYNHLTYYDYPHRTLTGLPTMEDVHRVTQGEGTRGTVAEQPVTKEQVKQWFADNWGKTDEKLIGNVDSKFPKQITLAGGKGAGKVGLIEKVDAILVTHAKENVHGLTWRTDYIN